MSEVKKPVALVDNHLEYLNNLRESGATNMFGARPFLINAFPELSKKEASEVLAYWMDTF